MIVISWFLETVNRLAVSPVLMLVVLFGGLYFTIKLKGFYILHPVKVIKGMLTGSLRTGESSFKSVTLALAGTLGVGNIVGVSSAILLGGAGAVFWMWTGALVSMALKYSEILLGVMYRRVRTTDKGVSYYGGAPYYIRDGLYGIGMRRMPCFLGGVFALFCIINSLTTGTAIQIGAVSEAAGNTMKIPAEKIALLLILFVALAMLIGKDKFSSITVVMIPAVSVVYIIMSLYIILNGLSGIPRVVREIFSQAFSVRSVSGGILGSTMLVGMRYGVSRGIISNEAGCGTAPAAHARANVKTSVQQGFWGIFEVFADTVVLCTMTAFSVLLTDTVPADDAMSYTLLSYESVIGAPAGYIMTACIFIFAYATVLCQYYYGIECLSYLSKKKYLRIVYTAVFFIMIACGAVTASEIIWQITDFSVGVMTVVNVTVIFILRKTVFAETEKYFEKKKNRCVLHTPVKNDFNQEL